MGIPNNVKESRHYMSQRTMMSLLIDRDTTPSTTNLFSIRFSTPEILRDTLKNRRYNNISTGETGQVLNYYASAINIPSKQLTTGQVSNIGVPYKYATGQAFSQINITFTVPRNHTTRTLFERWVQAISGDGDQYVDYYEDYICDELNIYKYEIGDGPEVRKTSLQGELNDIFLGENKSTQKKNRDKMRVPKLMAVYQLRNIFPTNIGSSQLNNMEPRLQSFNVSFSYERYKFYTDGPDANNSIRVSTDPESAPGIGFGFGVRND